MELVLVVDSHRDALISLTKDLSGLRLRLMGTSVLSRGLDLARTGTPDLILLGMEKSWEEIMEFLRSLRSDDITKHTPVMMIVDEPDREKVLQARGQGVLEFVIRPYDVEALRNKVRQILQSHTKITAEHKAGEDDFKLLRTGNRSYVFLSGKLQESLEGPLERALTRSAAGGELVIIDLRGIHDMEGEGPEIFLRILKRISGAEVICVAGRHYGPLLQAGADDMCHLLLSRGEMEEYLKLREEGRDSSSHPPVS